jgi:hypothetical protein
MVSAFLAPGLFKNLIHCRKIGKVAEISIYKAIKLAIGAGITARSKLQCLEAHS